MRISGGSLRGRPLVSPPEGVMRPTQDAVREAVFSMLAAVVQDCGFLDLFAGTGAVGLEAWSRGAARVTWVENGPRSLRALSANLAKCCGEPLPPQL
ncbi:MAG: RsmD family RNA methyltransferase, partial [Kiritimatiellae bacterium]|nr:RsmD family RNA methyltransferase [Kiritimatiellia bacterium]